MHRDIKPSNILIDSSDCTLKYCDFGQARVSPESLSDLDRPAKYSLEVGNKWYKAPELLFGSRTYNCSMDVWSLGCLIAELVQLALIHGLPIRTPGPLF